MESHCLFRFDFSSLIKSISKIRQSSLFWHFPKILKFRASHLGTYCADPSGGFRLQFPCALQFVGDCVGTCSRHNLHHTGYTEDDKQRRWLVSLTLISTRNLQMQYADNLQSSVGRSMQLSALCTEDQHNMSPNDFARNFKILRKCQNKLDCLIFEMLFIKELKPTLNKQCDSIRAKLFV